MLHKLHLHTVNYRASPGGFTLIEIVVVMLIITIIVAGTKINLDSGSRQATMKSAAKSLYRNFKYAQDEAILSGKTLAVNISEKIDLDNTEDAQHNPYYEFIWLELHAQQPIANTDTLAANLSEGETPDTAVPVNPLNEELQTRSFILFGTAKQVDLEQSLSRTEREMLLKGMLENLDADDVLSINKIPDDFTLQFEQNGEHIDPALFHSKEGTALERAAAQETDTDIQKVESTTNTENNFTAHIRIYPDGEVDEFKIILKDNKAENQGYVIKSDNGFDIEFGSLSGDET